MSGNRFLPLALAVVLACALGCGRKAEMHRAQQLEQQGRPGQALEIYKSQYATTPEYQHERRADLQYRMGECLLAMGRTREAFSAYSRAVDIDDRHQLAHLRLGEMYLLSGSGENASEQAEAILSHGDATIDALALLGDAASVNGNYEVARKAFETILEKDPKQVKVALSLAELLTRIGEPDKAIEVLQKASEAQPQSSAPWVGVGRIQETLGHIKPAEDAYRKAVQIEDTPETNLRLAQYLERTARVEEAKAVLLHVDVLRPSFPTANADFAFISDRTGEARERYLSALNGLVPPTAPPSEERAKTIARLVEADLAGQNNDPNAKSRISPVLLAQKHLDYFRRELDPATQHMLDAEIALANNDLPSAGVHADAAVQLAPDSAPAAYIAGMVKSRSGDFVGAHSSWENALENDDEHIPTRLALAQLSLDQQDLKGAIGYVVPVVRQEPGNYRALLLFGRVLLAQKEYDSAQVIASRAEVIAPASTGPDLLRGEIALATNDPGQALIHFQKAVIRDPQCVEAVDGLERAYRSGTVTRGMLLNIERIGMQEPVSAVLLEISGRLFAERGWKEDARRAFTESLAADPTRASAALQLARVLAEFGEAEKAAEYAVLIPSLSQVVQGVAAEQRGDQKSAISLYEAAFRAGDRSGVAANNLAWLYASKGINLDRALTAAQHAVESIPDDASVVDTLGFVYLQRREYSDAVKTLEHARIMARASRSPELKTIEEHLHTAYVNAGQPEQAAGLRASK